MSGIYVSPAKYLESYAGQRLVMVHREDLEAWAKDSEIITNQREEIRRLQSELAALRKVVEAAGACRPHEVSPSVLAALADYLQQFPR